MWLLALQRRSRNGHAGICVVGEQSTPPLRAELGYHNWKYETIFTELESAELTTAIPEKHRELKPGQFTL